MKTLKQKVKEILNNKDNFPLCVVNHASRINDIIAKSNDSYLTIKKSYHDIWIDFVKNKHLNRFSRHGLSKYLSMKYDRTILSEFYKLRVLISNKNTEITYQRNKLDAELRLLYADTNELREVLSFIESYNSSRSIEKLFWVDILEPEVLSEIILWRKIAVFV